MAKRLFDLLVAGLGLLLLAPLFAVIAMWVRLDSPGPVFFRQERVGRYGVAFRIHKFRTMVDGAPAQRAQPCFLHDVLRRVRVHAAPLDGGQQRVPETESLLIVREAGAHVSTSSPQLSGASIPTDSDVRAEERSVVLGRFLPRGRWLDR